MTKEGTVHTCDGEGAMPRPLDLEEASVRPPLPPLEAELSLDSIDTLSEKAESLSGLSVRAPITTQHLIVVIITH